MKFRHNITLKILIFVQIFFVFSCRTNKVPEKGHLYIGNKFKYEDKKGKPYLDGYGMPYIDKKGNTVINQYKEPFSDELENYVKPKPNKKTLFVIPLGLWIYNRSDNKFDSIYNAYYGVESKLRNQKLLDSLYIKYNFNSYVGRSRWFDRFFYHNGEAPVLVDSTIIRINSNNLRQYFVNRGWRKATISDSILPSGKKAIIEYKIRLGRPTLMDSLIFDIADEMKEDLYERYVIRNQANVQKHKKGTSVQAKDAYIKMFFKRNSVLKQGDRLDAYVLGDEITKLENRFKNMGYYGFNELKDEVVYYVDTANSIYNVPVKLTIKKSELLKASQSESEKKHSLNNKFKRFVYKELNITLEDPENARGEKYPIDSSYYVIDKKIIKIEDGVRTKGIIKDTVAFIINKTGGRYKNRVLTDMLAIERGDFYRLNSEMETRRNIYKVNNFNILSFDSKRGENSDSTLITNIIFSPMPKYSYEIGYEAFLSKIVNYGITPNITFLAKNLFGGAENLSVSFGGSLGNIQSKKNNSKLFNASELSAQTSLSFPKLLLPFNTQKIIPKNWGPSSAISVGYNAQYNIGLDKRNYSAAISYNFAPTRTTMHQISLWNLQYTQFLNPENYFNIYDQDAIIRNKVFDEYFKLFPNEGIDYQNNKMTAAEVQERIQKSEPLRDLLMTENPILLSNYSLVESRRYRFTQNTLISSFRYDFTYDQRLGYFSQKNPFYLRAQLELAGNALSLFNKSFKDFVTNNNKTVKEILGVPYSQFIKIDVDIRKYWKLSATKSVNARFFSGIGIPYGNSFALPFDRNYSVGGPSDVRAWKAFGFGPGDSKLKVRDGYELIALESFKLLSSIEYRFPLPSKGFEGALFVDAGNVWGIRKDSPNKFEFDTFYQQLGIGAGWGIRWNISNFIVRFDFAYKLHDPTREEGDRWYFKYLQPLKMQVNFAIDYPF